MPVKNSPNSISLIPIYVSRSSSTFLIAFSSTSVGFVEIKGEKEQKYDYIHADFKLTSNSPLIILSPILVT